MSERHSAAVCNHKVPNLASEVDVVLEVRHSFMTAVVGKVDKVAVLGKVPNLFAANTTLRAFFVFQNCVPLILFENEQLHMSWLLRRVTVQKLNSRLHPCVSILGKGHLGAECPPVAQIDG